MEQALVGHAKRHVENVPESTYDLVILVSGLRLV